MKQDIFFLRLKSVGFELERMYLRSPVTARCLTIVFARITLIMKPLPSISRGTTFIVLMSICSETRVF